mmetsp:Transcript_92228/g.266168  ORF Transcript_92228/g.266168 Transcript_92228/m.266168 type:complete len:834 (-) Transcript_92228:66-2567(-)
MARVAAAALLALALCRGAASVALPPSNASGVALVQVAHGGRRVRHRHGHRRLRGSSRSGRKADLSLDDALEALPVRVHEMYMQVKVGAVEGKDFVAALNEVYTRAQAEHDELTFKCKEKSGAVKSEVEKSRAALMETEQAITQLQDRMQSIQHGIDASLAELEALRGSFEEKRKACKKNEETQANALQMLNLDLPQATALTKKVTANCNFGGGTPVDLVECSLPDSSYVVTFKDQDLRKTVSSLSGLSERVLALQLERAVRGEISRKATAAADKGKSFVQMAARRHRLASVNRTSSPLQFLQVAGDASRDSDADQDSDAAQDSDDSADADGDYPDDWCAAAPPLPCESFADYMASFAGGVEDLVDELKIRANDEADHCNEMLDQYAARIKKLKRQSDDAGVELANAVAQQSDLETARRMQREQLKELTKDTGITTKQCEDRLQDSSTAMCSAKVLAREVAPAAGEFMGDCVVSDWVPSACSKSCGKGGEQTLTRRVIFSASEKAKCPPLELKRKCNEKPCPVDGVMGRWQDWSQCSQACGGGTRSRRRDVVRQAEHGGLPTGETMQEERCNVHPCDQDCVLTHWTEWSTCSKACNSGHRSRVRNVVRPAIGNAMCPDEHDAERWQSMSCNTEKCKEEPVLKCKDMMDVVFALDSSGSMGTDGFKSAQEFLQAVIDRMTLQAEDKSALTQVGLVKFGAKVEALSQLSTDAAALKGAISGAKFTPSQTNTGEALAIAAQILDQHGRPSVHSTVVVVTDGMPASSYILRSEAERLKKRGVRLVFVLVGAGISRRTVELWASWPMPENIIRVRSFAGLKKKETATAILAALCPKFEK